MVWFTLFWFGLDWWFVLNAFERITFPLLQQKIRKGLQNYNENSLSAVILP